QQEIRDLDRSVTPQSTPAIPRQSSTSEALQAELEQPVPASNASGDERQACDAEDATCGKSTVRISRATRPGVGAQHASSPGRLSMLSPLRPDDSTRQESTPGHDSARESVTSAGGYRASQKWRWFCDSEEAI